MLAGLAPSSQTVGSLLKTPGQQSSPEKKWNKSEFGKFTSMEKYAQPLLIERSRQSQNFKKVGFIGDDIFVNSVNI